MTDLRVDRERLIKVAAMVGLAILAISILPGLLRTPDPPDLPPDVGFRPSEATAGQFLPSPRRSVDKAGEKSSKDRQETGKAGKKKDHRIRGENRPGRSRKPNQRRHKPGSKAKKDPDPASGPAASVSSPAPAPVPAPAPQPVTSTAPPPVYTPPSPSPPPAPAQTRPPGDGSQEFAPR